MSIYSNILQTKNVSIGKDVLLCVEKSGYAVVDCWITDEILKKARAEYEFCMRTLPLHAQGEKFRPIDLRSTPWRKQAIGSRVGSGAQISQVLQTTYFSPKNCEQFPALNAIFTEMIQVRNELTDMQIDYGNNLEKDEFWNACRVHHYPQGGGHMAAHRDTLFPQLLQDFKIPFLQIMVTLSTRNIDFNTGGGYFTDQKGQKIFFETDINPGSLVLFNGDTLHGVDDIDSNELLDFSSTKGRIALFVNLYKNQNF